MSPALAGSAESALRALALAGREGRPATEAERRRLGLIAGAALALISLLALGPGPATMVAALGPALAERVLGRRRRTYVRGVERRVPEIASGLADALAAGASLRNAVTGLATTLEGPAGAELTRVAADLELGTSPARSLRALAERLGSDPVAALVAAALSQQRSGGDLAALLRRHARAAVARRRALAAARSATAQARLTGGMVAVMPIAAALLVELASPGFLASLLAESASALLVGVALVLQLAAYLVIQWLGRVRG